MNSIIKIKDLYRWLLIIAVALQMGCDEKIAIIEESTDPPVIVSFEPLSGEVGTIINIKGEYLKNVDSVSLGEGTVKILRIINDNEMEVQVTFNSKSGELKVFSPFGSDASSDSFTFEYSVPEIIDFPVTGIINQDVSFTGINLHEITSFYLNDGVKDTEGKIMYQENGELAVKVPFILLERASWKLKYNTETGEDSIMGSPFGFVVVKPDYSVTSIPTAALTGSEVVLLGENINLTDSIYFGDELAEIVTARPSFIKVKVPEFDERTFVTIRIVYFQVEEIVSEFETEVYTKFRKVLSNFEAGTDNFEVDEKYATPDQIVMNGDDSLSAPEGNNYVHFSHPMDPDITSSVVGFFNYDEGEDNLINFNAFEDPVLHFYYTNKGTPSYLQLQVLVGGIKMRMYVERYRTDTAWHLYCIRLKDVKFKDSWTSPTPVNLDWKSYEYLRLNFKPDADEEILVNLDYVFVSEGAISGAYDLTRYTKEDGYILEIVE